MAKPKTLYTCQNCGFESPKWQGRCTDCGEWNTFVEETKSTSARGWQNTTTHTPENAVIALSESVTSDESQRDSTTIGELDRVLGGGLVNGSFILLGGEPGIGKSTLLLQTCHGLSKSGLKILYNSGEESVKQGVLRAQRLKIKSDQILMSGESELPRIINLIKQREPDVAIIDSIQTIFIPELASAPGSVTQVRECAGELLKLAKGSGITIFLVGHVNKDGHIAGPKVLEHMVDTVLSFEGDSQYQFRLLRAVKNRFGASNELGVFSMNNDGLREVNNPSELFLEERAQTSSGSAVLATMEGTRPILCEVQALALKTNMAMPRRTCVGIDQARCHLLAAVLDKSLDTEFSFHDIFVNIVGGLKVMETAADLAIAAALLSNWFDKVIPQRTLFFGEIGLTGEIRNVPFIEDRLREAIKLGFDNFVIPKSGLKFLSENTSIDKKSICALSNIDELRSYFTDL